MPNRSAVLALDDDTNFLNNLKFALGEKFNIIPSSCAEDAYQVFERQKIDAIILDYYLGQENGHAVLDNLRLKNLNQPVIVVSGVVDLPMTVGFLKRRVFGFLEKPFSIAEIETLLQEATAKKSSNGLSAGFVLEPQTRKVKVGDKSVALTPTEYEILTFFINNRGRQVTRTEITSFLWGETQVSRHTFDTHLLNLKKKLPVFADKLISIYGTGYCYDA